MRYVQIAAGEKEIWRDIVGYDGDYQISTLGRQHVGELISKKSWKHLNIA